jgi:hypothetical protein
MSEQGGRQLLKETFPNFAHMVDPVVAAFGDSTKVSEQMQRQTDELVETEEAALESANMNDNLRRVLSRQRNAITQVRDDSGRFSILDDSAKAGNAGDMNSLLRASTGR